MILATLACSSSPPARTPQQRADATASVVAALQASQFDDAARQAGAVLAADPGNARAAAARAIASYVGASSSLIVSLGKLVDGARHPADLGGPAARGTWQAFLDQLAAIDRDLAVVAGDPGFSLELCLACWRYDWNHNGQIDARDQRLFELEADGAGGALPEGDARRRPTFRFDTGDAEWARAMIAFQRAVIELGLAYDWSAFYAALEQGHPPAMTIKLIDRPRVVRVRALILAGLAAADRSRVAYLAETDDDREWVPNPRQTSHPIPFPVDAALYETWAGVISDVRAMLESRDGLSIRQAAALIHGPTAALFFPDMYVDLGHLLADPHDFVLDFQKLKGEGVTGIDSFLRGLLGAGYHAGMHASPLIDRLSRMKQDLERGGETLEHKLRYLLWLN